LNEQKFDTKGIVYCSVCVLYYRSAARTYTYFEQDEYIINVQSKVHKAGAQDGRVKIIENIERHMGGKSI